MDQKLIKANVRTEVGKGVANRLRNAGRVPAVVYGCAEDAQSLDVDATEFLKVYKDVTETTVINLDVAGKVCDAFVKAVDFDIVTEQPLHIDFYKVDSKKTLTRKIAIKVQGNAVGIRDGGALNLGASFVEVSCLPKFMPSLVTIDVSNLGLNETITAGDVKFEGDVKLVSPADVVIAAVKKA